MNERERERGENRLRSNRVSARVRTAAAAGGSACEIAQWRDE